VAARVAGSERCIFVHLVEDSNNFIEHVQPKVSRCPSLFIFTSSANPLIFLAKLESKKSSPVATVEIIWSGRRPASCDRGQQVRAVSGEVRPRPRPEQYHKGTAAVSSTAGAGPKHLRLRPAPEKSKKTYVRTAAATRCQSSIPWALCSPPSA
jgi:hypothetical protein